MDKTIEGIESIAGKAKQGASQVSTASQDPAPLAGELEGLMKGFKVRSDQKTH